MTKTFLGSLLIFVLLLVASLFVGPADLSALSSEETSYILFQLRVPRTLALVAIGASLSLCGVLLQTLLGNPLAEPFTLGLSGASTLGAVLFLFFGFSPQWLSLPLGSLMGSFLAIALVLSMQKSLLEKSNALILTGVMVSFFSGAFVTLLISIMSPHQMQQALFWMMGQVGSPRDVWAYALLPIFILIFLFFFRRANTLDKLLLGHTTATNLNVSVVREKFWIVALTSFLTSLCVSISGLVGFVGLVAPHLTYLFLKTRRHKKVFLMAPLLGANLFLMADILSRLISQNTDIPAGSLMALLGAPILIWFLMVRYKPEGPHV